MTEFLHGPWAFDLFYAVNLTLVAVGYVSLTRSVRSSGRRWPISRTVMFLSGMACLALVYLGPVAGWSHTFFWAHMAQHLVVMMVAAPLLALGAPLLLVREAASARYQARIDRALNSQVAGWLTDPIVTWVLFASTLIGVHFTGFYDWALSNHDAELFVERPLFLVVALLYYAPLIGNNPLAKRPTPAVKLISLGAMMIPEAIVGAVIYFAPVVLYPTFARDRPFGLDPLADQRLSGAIMWAVVMVIDTMWMMLVAAEWFSSEEKRSHEVDREIAREQAAIGAGDSAAATPHPTP